MIASLAIRKSLLTRMDSLDNYNLPKSSYTVFVYSLFFSRHAIIDFFSF